jgi:hypothetical protein
MTGERDRTAVDFEAFWRFGEEMIEQIGKNHPGYTDYRRLLPCKADERSAPTTRTA